jgi:hypothetical protein
MSKRLENIEKLMVRRVNNWTKEDYVDAYEDEWDEIPYSLEECGEKMEAYINNTYSDELIIDCLDNEPDLKKITAIDVLNWHGSEHGIQELAKVLADIVNGEYDISLCKQEILDCN